MTIWEGLYAFWRHVCGRGLNPGRRRVAVKPPADELRPEYDLTQLKRVPDYRRLSADQQDALEGLADGLQELAKHARDVPQPLRSVITTQIFIMVQTVKYLQEGPEAE